MNISISCIKVVPACLMGMLRQSPE